MTRINFYILQSDNEQSLLEFCCKLVEKAAKQGNTVLIHTESEHESNVFDDLLWQFRPESFVPHSIVQDENSVANEPVQISHINMASSNQDVLINLTNTVPTQFARHPRFVQIVNQQSERLASSRKHFAFFKERGYPIEINKLNH